MSTRALPLSVGQCHCSLLICLIKRLQQTITIVRDHHNEWVVVEHESSRHMLSIKDGVW